MTRDFTQSPLVLYNFMCAPVVFGVIFRPATRCTRIQQAISCALRKGTHLGGATCCLVLGRFSGVGDTLLDVVGTDTLLTASPLAMHPPWAGVQNHRLYPACEDSGAQIVSWLFTLQHEVFNL